MVTKPLCILSNFTVAEVNCQGVVGLIVTSIIVTVALRDDIIKCSQAIDLRVEGTGGSGIPRWRNRGFSSCRNSYWQIPAWKETINSKQGRIREMVAYTLPLDSQSLHPLREEQLAAVATVARPAITITEAINLVNCMVKR